MSKITDKDELTSVDSGDKFPVIDVSDTTADAAGTLKFVEGNNLVPLDFLKVRYQSDNSNSIASSTQTGLTMQIGWVQIIGNDTGEMTHAVTFPTAFTTVLWIQAAYIGGLSPGPATSITGLVISGSGQIACHASAVSTTGLTIGYKRDDANFGSSAYYAASWIAIGIV